jgi:hypothetical protein
MGVTFFYLGTSEIMGTLLIGLSCSLVPITTFLKSFSSSLDSSSFTSDFYYICIFLTAVILSISQFIIGCWFYFTEDYRNEANNLINYAINLVCISIFIKQLSPKTETDTDTTTIIPTTTTNIDIPKLVITDDEIKDEKKLKT